MERPDGIVDFAPDPALYPFESRWFTSSVGPVHYIDEGQGRPLLLFHGNPDWSFLYRKIVSALRPDFRCVVPDYPGFGLSVHPDGYGYTAAEHAKIIGELVEHLNLTDMVVMGQDWGGPIGMDVASRHPNRVHGLVMGNTWFWPAISRNRQDSGVREPRDSPDGRWGGRTGQAPSPMRRGSPIGPPPRSTSAGERRAAS